MSPFHPAVVTEPDPMYLSTYSRNSLGDYFHGTGGGVPTSTSYGTSNRAHFLPFYVSKPYLLARWFWCNGGTASTDYREVGIYDQDFNLLRCSPRTLAAGATANQYATPGIHGTNVTDSHDAVDQDTYTTASVTMRTGVLYLMAVVNSHASSAPVVSSIDSATGGVPTFTSRSSVQYSSNAQRVSIWSAVPTADFTGTLRINFGGSSGVTGCVWSLNGFLHVDTTTNDGIVQNATGTGSSTTPLATLAAYGSANNAGFGAFGSFLNNVGAPTSATTFELSDTQGASPNRSLQCSYTYNDTTMDYTISSGAWGAAAVELKSLGTAAIWIPPMRGWLAVWQSGTTAIIMRPSNTVYQPYNYAQSSLTAGLPITATPAGQLSTTPFVYGFTSRASP